MSRADSSAASRAADFILTKMRRPDGRLLHVWRGEAKLDAYLDDYACLANGLASLYEVGFDERYIDEAVRLAEIMLAHFADRDGGGFYFTADDHEELVARQKDWQDSSTPSGNAMAAAVLLRLGKLIGGRDFSDSAVATLQAAAGLMERFPSAAGQMLAALDFHLGPTPEIVILGDDDTDTRRRAWQPAPPLHPQQDRRVPPIIKRAGRNFAAGAAICR